MQETVEQAAEHAERSVEHRQETTAPGGAVAGRRGRAERGARSSTKDRMTESATYKIVEIAGTSPESIAEGVAALFAVWA